MIEADGIILIDKSFLQQTKENEARRLNAYNVLVCPPLHDEICGNISKKDESGKFQASYAEVLAKKVPENAHYIEHAFVLSNLNLLGQHISMDGRLPLIDESKIYTDNLSVYQSRLRSWAKGIFLSFEQENSIQRRSIISQFKEIRFQRMISILNAAGYSEYTCQSLEKAKKMAQEALINIDKKDFLDLIFRQLQISQTPHLKDQKPKIAEFCKDKNYMELKINCPYAMYVLELEVFFQIALAAKLIKVVGNSLSDAWYLHYLPFCKYFVSDDNLHRRCAPIFMKDYQKFIWGADFREFLKIS